MLQRCVQAALRVLNTRQHSCSGMMSQAAQDSWSHTACSLLGTQDKHIPTCTMITHSHYGSMCTAYT
jgi:hypothetical protein